MDRSTRPIAIALLLIQSAVARAEPPCASALSDQAVAPATELAGQGRQAMAAGKFEDALQLYERAYCLLPEPILKHGLSSAELNAGRCEEAVRDARFWADHAAKENADEALRWREEVLRQCAEVTIVSTPPGAEVLFDDGFEAAGITPWHGWLKSGSHAIEGRLAGHDPAKTRVLVPEGLNQPLLVTLELAARNETALLGSEGPREAAKRLASEGAAAYKATDYAKAVEKFIAAYRLYPATPLLLNISRADLKLSRCNEALHFAEQFKTEAPDIKETSPDSPDLWLATLRRSCIEAEVVSNPPDATIWIDGERQTAPEKTPWSGRLPVGKHKVLLWRSGYQKQGAFLQVTADSPARLELTLYPSATASPDVQPVAVARSSPPQAAPKVDLLPPPRPTSEAPATRATRRPVLRSVGYGAIAVGGAALIVATILGVAERNAARTLGTNAVPRSVAQTNGALSTTQSEATGADALFVVGSVLAAAGVPLAVVF